MAAAEWDHVEVFNASELWTRAGCPWTIHKLKDHVVRDDAPEYARFYTVRYGQRGMTRAMFRCLEDAVAFAEGAD